MGNFTLQVYLKVISSNNPLTRMDWTQMYDCINACLFGLKMLISSNQNIQHKLKSPEAF